MGLPDVWSPVGTGADRAFVSRAQMSAVRITLDPSRATYQHPYPARTP
jgi:hypothetical protein